MTATTCSERSPSTAVTGRVVWVGMRFAAVTAALGGALCVSGCSGDTAVIPVSADGAVDAQVDATLAEAASEHPTDASTENAVAEGAPDVAEDRGAGGCVPYDAASLDALAVDAGSTLVQSVSPPCSVCHGADYSGNLVVVTGAYSANLTPDPATGLGCWTDEQITSAILVGRTPDGGSLCVMRRWSSQLSPDDAENVALFLRSLPAVSKAVTPTDCAAIGYGPDAGDGGLGDADAGDGSIADAGVRDGSLADAGDDPRDGGAVDARGQ